MIIENDTQLRRYIPNTFMAVDGEVPLYEKIKKQIEQSESRLRGEITGDYELEPQDEELLRQATAYDAMLWSVPALDMVLTPNGFGIVSTNSIAPASRERVSALRQSLTEKRDMSISVLLSRLVREEEYRQTPHGKTATSTLFPIPQELRAIWDKELWENYKEAKHIMEWWEAEAAEEWVSHQLMSRIRESNARGEGEAATIEAERKIAAQLKAVEYEYVRDVAKYRRAVKRLNIGTMRRVVETIKGNETLYGIWKETETGRRFEYKGYQNDKKSGGYWL